MVDCLKREAANHTTIQVTIPTSIEHRIVIDKLAKQVAHHGFHFEEEMVELAAQGKV